MMSMEFSERDLANNYTDEKIQILVKFINYQANRITELEKRVEELEKRD